MAEATRPIRTERIGRILILVGVSVWVVYGIVWLAGGDPQTAHYLPVHLSGVLPGAVLARWGSLAGWFRRRLPAAS